MGKKKRIYVRITDKDNYLKNKKLSLPKCSHCKEQKNLNKYPCEIEYITEGKVHCEDTITLCSKCFDSNNMYTCYSHNKDIDINKTICEFTGLYPNDSPVYFKYGDLGIRKVGDYECNRCKNNYKVCHEHIKIEYKYCRSCLIKMTDDGFTL